VRDNDVAVDFTVRVPEGVRLIARTVNGGVGAASLSSDVEAYTVNGRIKLSTTGVASAETVNGSIEASLGAAKWTEPWISGRSTLDHHRSARGAAAELRAETLNGRIMVDFPVTIRTLRRGGRRIAARLDPEAGAAHRHHQRRHPLRSAAGR